MSDYGVKISKSGYDVKTATDSNLMFSSSILTNPVKEIVSISMTSSPYTYNHGLGFAPKVWLFYNDGSYWKRVPFEDYFESIDYEIDSTSVIIRATSGLLPASLKLIIFIRKVTD